MRVGVRLEVREAELTAHQTEYQVQHRLLQTWYQEAQHLTQQAEQLSQRVELYMSILAIVREQQGTAVIGQAYIEQQWCAHVEDSAQDAGTSSAATVSNGMNGS